MKTIKISKEFKKYDSTYFLNVIRSLDSSIFIDESNLNLAFSYLDDENTTLFLYIIHQILINSIDFFNLDTNSIYPTP